MTGQFSLLARRRFAPLFVTQFLGAFNDNLFKNALVILIAFRLAAQSSMSGPLLVTLAAGIFILPFFLFSAWAGQLADRHDKARLIRIIKFAEIPIMLAGAAALFAADLWSLMAVLFLMGSQSAFFGPLKYGILPDHLRAEELVGGNALIEAATFLAILFGTILGSILVLRDHGVAMVAFLMVTLAALGYGASRFVPAAPAAAPDLKLSINPFAAMAAIMRVALRPPEIFAAILGISWFWLVGATFLAQFPNLVKMIGGDETVVAFFLVLFAVGIGLGSLLCNLLLKGAVSLKLLPWSALMLAAASAHFAWAAEAMTGAGRELAGIVAFLGRPGALAIVADLVVIAAAGGVFAVPLYAFIQARADIAVRARVIAALNVMNSAFMVASAVLGLVLLGAGMAVPILLGLTGGLTLPAALILARYLAQRERRIASDMSALASGPSHSAGPR